MKKVTSVLITLTFVVSLFYIAAPVNSSEPSQPEYIPMKVGPEFRETTLPLGEAPEVIGPGHHSYHEVGDVVTWLGLDDFNGWYFWTDYELRAIGTVAEVWVQVDLTWPEGDERSTPIITPDQVAYILEEFETNIYPTDTTFFGTPDFHDGTYSLLEAWGYVPEGYYSEESGRNVILISNVRDINYYYDWYPYYISGFYSPDYEAFFNRNVITIDSYEWEDRTGPGVTWPYAYEATTAHEYQHLIHDDYNPYDALFMNEGCSMFAEILCNYPIPWSDINSFLATPDNSLTIWGDQGGINILADYGGAALWAVYLSDHFGGANFISYFVQAGIPGIDGINAALEHFGYTETFDDVFHDWRIANLIHSDFPGCGKYNYKTIDLNEADPVRVYEEKVPFIEMKGTDFGPTITTLGYDTGIEEIFQYGTDYIQLTKWKKLGLVLFDGNDEAYYGWRLTDEGLWYSGRYDLMDTLLVANAHINPCDPWLRLTTYYEIEESWDFGFVQISTNGGTTWTSLENANTTYDHHPSAHPNIVANIPGLTGSSDDWITMNFDLSAYVGGCSGEDVMIGFRYMTDWATYEEGWYISEASVSRTPLELTTTGEYPDVEFQVTLVYTYKICGHLIHIPWDMCLDEETKEGISFLLFKPKFVTLVVSPIMDQGDADYSFSAITWNPWHWWFKPSRSCWC